MKRTGLMLLLLVLATQLQAQQYRWIDEKGRVQYTDTPPPPGAKGVQKKNLGAGAVVDGQQEPFELTRARKAAPVKFYSAPECEACDDARKLLNQRGIPFTEVSVVENTQKDELRAISGRLAVPVLIVGSSMLRTFNDSIYNNALDAAGYPQLGNLPPRNQQPPAVAKKAPAPAAAQ